MGQKTGSPEIEDIIKRIEDVEVIPGKRFDEYLSFEGIPIWWFYKRFFTQYTISFIPSQLLTTEDIKKMHIGKAGLIKRAVISRAIAKAIWLNEWRKIRFFSGKKPPALKENSVLFLTYSNHIHGKNIFRLQSILDIMAERKGPEPAPIFVDPFPSTKHKQLSGRRTIYSYINKKMIDDSKKISRRMADRWKRIPDKNRLLTENRYWAMLRPTFDFLFSKELMFLSILYYKAFHEVMSTGKISLAVGTGLDSIHEKAMIVAAHKEGIPSLAIQHCGGVLDLPPKIEYLTDISTFNETDKKLIEKHGLSPEHIHISGPVIYDDASKFAGKNMKERRSVFIATSPVVEDGFLAKKTYFERIERVLKGIGDAAPSNITIKLHPREKYLKVYEKIVADIGLPDTVIKPGSISGNEFYAMIAEHDIFVHFGSNASIEAMIIGRPVVTVSIADKDHTKDFFTSWITKDHVSINVGYSGNITGSIEKAFQPDQKIQKKVDVYIKDRCGIIDGKCSERIVDTIEKLSGKKSIKIR